MQELGSGGIVLKWLFLLDPGDDGSGLLFVPGKT